MFVFGILWRFFEEVCHAHRSYVCMALGDMCDMPVIERAAITCRTVRFRVVPSCVISVDAEGEICVFYSRCGCCTLVPAMGPPWRLVN